MEEKAVEGMADAALEGRELEGSWHFRLCVALTRLFEDAVFHAFYSNMDSKEFSCRPL